MIFVILCDPVIVFKKALPSTSKNEIRSQCMLVASLQANKMKFQQTKLVHPSLFFKRKERIITYLLIHYDIFIVHACRCYHKHILQ